MVVIPNRKYWELGIPLLDKNLSSITTIEYILKLPKHIFFSIQTDSNTIIVFYRLFRQNVAHNCDCCDDDSYFILKTIGEETLDEEEIWAFSSANKKLLFWFLRFLKNKKSLFSKIFFFFLPSKGLQMKWPIKMLFFHTN